MPSPNGMILTRSWMFISLADCLIVYLLLLFSFSFCEAISDFDDDFANDDELSDDEDED